MPETGIFRSFRSRRRDQSSAPKAREESRDKTTAARVNLIPPGVGRLGRLRTVASGKSRKSRKLNGTARFLGRVAPDETSAIDGRRSPRGIGDAERFKRAPKDGGARFEAREKNVPGSAGKRRRTSGRLPVATSHMS